MNNQIEEPRPIGEANVPVDPEANGGAPTTLVPSAIGQPPAINLVAEADWPAADFPRPAVLDQTTAMIWDEDAPQALNYIALGQRLAGFKDIYRNPQHGGGLLLASSCPAIPPTPITKGARLAPVIVDRLVVAVIKKGKPAGSQIPTRQLEVMLASEVFLQQFPPLDTVATTPMYLGDFTLTALATTMGGLDSGSTTWASGPPSRLVWIPSTVSWM